MRVRACGRILTASQSVLFDVFAILVVVVSNGRVRRTVSIGHESLFTGKGWTRSRQGHL